MEGEGGRIVSGSPWDRSPSPGTSGDRFGADGCWRIPGMIRKRRAPQMGRATKEHPKITPCHLIAGSNVTAARWVNTYGKVSGDTKANAPKVGEAWRCGDRSHSWQWGIPERRASVWENGKTLSRPFPVSLLCQGTASQERHPGTKSCFSHPAPVRKSVLPNQADSSGGSG